MARIKQIRGSENGMKIVNTLFLLSALIRNRGIIFIACIVWIIYLLYCIKHTQSKAARWIYIIFAVYAAILLLLNILTCFGFFS